MSTGLVTDVEALCLLFNWVQMLGCVVFIELVTGVGVFIELVTGVGVLCLLNWLQALECCVY